MAEMPKGIHVPRRATGTAAITAGSAERGATPLTAMQAEAGQERADGAEGSAAEARAVMGEVDPGHDHAERRRAFYAQFPVYWSEVQGREYALYDVFDLSPLEQQSIRDAASAIYGLYARTATLLRALDDATLLGLGLPESTLAFAREVVPGMPETVIGRVDLLKTPHGYKMLEFNSDTPAFEYECHVLNPAVCRQLGVRDPNAGQTQRLRQALADAVLKSITHLGKAETDSVHVVFTSYPHYPEDRGTATFLMDLMDLPGPLSKCFCEIGTLTIDDAGLYDAAGTRIDVLYRLYPVEFFAKDRDPKSGTRIGEQLFSLVRRRRLALINPPSAFLLQSKAVQALIWGLWEENAFFDAAEREAIERHLLPTYLDPVFEDRKHVVKPVFGREGGSVTIVDPANHRSIKSERQAYSDQMMVYQEYVEMPVAAVMTTQGMRSLPILTSCFVVGGQAGAIGLRAGGPITDHLCYFLPAGSRPDLKV